MADRASYMDFIPVFSHNEYTKINELVAQANAFLSANPASKVTQCETIRSKYYINTPGNAHAHDVSTQRHELTSKGFWVSHLRIWFRQRTQQDTNGPSQIGYINVVPAITKPGGGSLAQFATFNQTVEQANQMIQAQPLPGTLINLETHATQLLSLAGKMEPDDGYWRTRDTHYLMFIRLFYELGTPTQPVIGVIDFIPQKIKDESGSGDAQYEPFTTLMTAANSWIQQNSQNSVISLQSVPYRIDKWNRPGDSLNPQNSEYETHRKHMMTKTYATVLRLCYVTGQDKSRPPIKNGLTVRTFMPYMTQSKDALNAYGHYEPMTMLQQRLHAWIQATGAKPLYIESVDLVLTSPTEPPDPDDTYTFIKAIKFYLRTFRVYFDGQYTEPPPEALPPPPVVQAKSAGCVIL